MPPPRYFFPSLLLLGLLSACVATGEPGHPAAFRCHRKGFAVVYAPPVGWTGPKYAGGPALDSWTLATGPAVDADMLETRVYDAVDSPIRWDTATESQILANFVSTYQNPRVEKVDAVTVDGHRTVVRAVHSAGIEEYLANVYYRDSLVSIMFTTSNPAELARQRATFLAFLGSLRFEQTR